MNPNPLSLPRMRALSSIVTLAAACNAFVPTPSARNPIPLKASSSDECSSAACDIPSELGETPSLVNVPNGANAILSAVVTNSDGDFVRIDDAIQSSKMDANAPHVVIFLRHMG